MKFVLKDLNKNPIQVYCDINTQLIDVLDSILTEIGGNAHIVVTTFSTSEDFLRRLFVLKNNGAVAYAVLLTDMKAANKTSSLNTLIQSCFDEVHLAQNHSKLLLIANSNCNVTVCTSQNQTRGNRLESGIITTDINVYNTFYTAISIAISKSVLL